GPSTGAGASRMDRGLRLAGCPAGARYAGNGTPVERGGFGGCAQPQRHRLANAAAADLRGGERLTTGRGPLGPRAPAGGDPSERSRGSFGARWRQPSAAVGCADPCGSDSQYEPKYEPNGKLVWQLTNGSVGKNQLFRSG